MKIEDVEKLSELRNESLGFANDSAVADKLDLVLLDALSALRAEAWHPIEKAEELGAKDGNSVLLFRIDYWAEGWWDSDYQCWMANDGEFKPSHFRFINLAGRGE